VTIGAAMPSRRGRTFRILRGVWLSAAILLLLLLTILGVDQMLLPTVGLMLISFPAGLLAAPIMAVANSFPVSIEGVPLPPTWWVLGLLVAALGYVQWFELLPRLGAWHRGTRMDR